MFFNSLDFPIGFAAIMTIVNYWMIFPIVILLTATIYVYKFYNETKTRLDLMVGIVRSPLFSHLTATLQGLTTIRAFASEEMFEKQFYSFLDDYSSVTFLAISVKNWFFNCDILGKILFIITTIVMLKNIDNNSS